MSSSYDETINNKLFFINKPLKFHLGIEFKRKEYCHWCNIIEKYGGKIYDEADKNTINLTKPENSHENDNNYRWHNYQFINDCINNNELVNIRNYRIIIKNLNKQKTNQELVDQDTIDVDIVSSSPKKKIKLTDDKLKMNTIVKLKSSAIPNVLKDEENNLNNKQTKQLNLSSNTKGIKVVDTETLLGSTYKLLKSTDDKSLKQNTDENLSKETYNNKNLSESMMDYSSQFDDSTNNTKQQEKLLINENSNSSLMNLQKKKSPKNIEKKFGDRILLGFRVREVPMASSLDEEYFNTTDLSFNGYDKLVNSSGESLLTDDDNEQQKDNNKEVAENNNNNVKIVECNNEEESDDDYEEALENVKKNNDKIIIDDNDDEENVKEDDDKIVISDDEEEKLFLNDREKIIENHDENLVVVDDDDNNEETEDDDDVVLIENEILVKNYDKKVKKYDDDDEDEITPPIINNPSEKCLFKTVYSNNICRQNNKLF